MEIRKIAAVAAIITVFAAAALAVLTGSINRSIPVTGFAVMEAASAPFPQDRIAESQIRAGEEAVVVRIANATIGRMEGTNSMAPLLGGNSTAIMIKPKAAEEIKEGDVIAYYSEAAGGLVVHRVVDVGNDEQGWFAVTKGDNAKASDPQKARFGQVKYVIIGILY